MKSMEDRITTLEKSARRWRLLAVGALILFGTSWLVGAGRDPVQAEVRTRQLIVVDEKGHELVLIGTSKDGGTVTCVAVGDDKKSANLSADVLGGRVIVMNPEGSQILRPAGLKKGFAQPAKAD